MVRIRGLRLVLGRVIRRALRTQVSAYARRKQATATVVEDVEHIDHPTDEPQEPVTNDVCVDAQDFLDKPHNTFVSTDYVYHMTTTIWTGEEHPELKLFFHGRKVQKFGRSTPGIEGIVALTGLSLLIACSLDTCDMGLIYVFAERWYKETSSFHLLAGEVTITLDDVTSCFYNFDALAVDHALELLVELLQVSTEEAKDETFQTRRAYVWLSWLRDIYRSKCDAGQ
ncbi:Protein MAIN-LIKE 2 [Glycine max]|nr:Protein MAIN-LIKE 2 [Glycine max]